MWNIKTTFSYNFGFVLFLALEMSTGIITKTFNCTLIFITVLFSCLPFLASFVLQFFLFIIFLKAQLGCFSSAPIHALITNFFWWVPPTAWTNVVIALGLSLKYFSIVERQVDILYIQYTFTHLDNPCLQTQCGYPWLCSLHIQCNCSKVLAR